MPSLLLKIPHKAHYYSYFLTSILMLSLTGCSTQQVAHNTVAVARLPAKAAGTIAATVGAKVGASVGSAVAGNIGRKVGATVGRTAGRLATSNQ